jgi:hypothetical protein
VVLQPKAIVSAAFDLSRPVVVFTGPHRKRNTGLTLSGHGTLEPAEALKQLGIEPDIGEIESSLVVNLDQDLTTPLLVSWLTALLALGLLVIGVLAPKALFLMVRSVVLFPLKFIIRRPLGDRSRAEEDDGACLVGRLVCYAESGRVTGVNLDGQNRMAIKIEVDALSEGDFSDAQFLVMARRDKSERTVFNLAVRDFGYFVNGVMVEPGTYSVEPGAMKIQGRAWSIVWELG